MSCCASVGEYRLLVLGVAVLVSVLFFPNGLTQLFAKSPTTKKLAFTK